MDMFKDVMEFHRKFNLERPENRMDLEIFKIRLKHITEEVIEFHQAFVNGDSAEVLDALIDLVYVALGTAELMNFPFEAGWDEVHKANMKKVRAKTSEESKRGTAFDVIKPEGWVPANIAGILEDYDAK